MFQYVSHCIKSFRAFFTEPVIGVIIQVPEAVVGDHVVLHVLISEELTAEGTSNHRSNIEARG